MPSEFLVRAEAPNKGAVVTVQPAGWNWGAKEALPKFVRVSVTDGDFSTAKALAEEWMLVLDLTLDSTTADSLTFTMSSHVVRESDGEGKITQSMVQELIDSWNLTVDNEGDNAITCTASAFGAASSSGYWGGVDLSLASFTDQGITDGRQIVDIDYSATGWAPNVVARRIAQRGAEVLSNDGAVVRLAVSLDQLRENLEFDLREYRSTIAERRYMIEESAVDQIVSNGGETSATEQQVIDNLIDLAAI